MWLRKKKESKKDSISEFIPLNSAEEFNELLAKSSDFRVFKHSGRCSISITAKKRLQNYLRKNDRSVYLVDVVNQRPLSLLIAQETQVTHESPQLIWLKDGAAVKHASHLSIAPDKFYE